MDRIKRVRVSIEPYLFSDRHVEMRVVVQLQDKEVTVTKYLDVGDFESLFDRVYKECGIQLKHEITQEEVKS